VGNKKKFETDVRDGFLDINYVSGPTVT